MIETMREEEKQHRMWLRIIHQRALDSGLDAVEAADILMDFAMKALIEARGGPDAVRVLEMLAVAGRNHVERSELERADPAGQA